jgi:RNA polymerase subunit RPABC4/transcription elongation factor Spt4
MATTKCLDCKKEISTSATKCPHCGSTVPNQLTAISILIAFGVTIYILIYLFY